MPHDTPRSGPRWLRQTDPNFENAFAALLADKRESDVDVDRQVAGIVETVRRQGDRALIDYTARFDRHRLAADDLRLVLHPRSRDVAPRARVALRAYLYRGDRAHFVWPWTFRAVADGGRVEGMTFVAPERSGLYRVRVTHPDARGEAVARIAVVGPRRLATLSIEPASYRLAPGERATLRVVP